uniref:Major histocompatibility complex class I-related gene protein-like n=1 Tax=Xiphophorus maculatus TaxID=8083 RepID=A0A3B5QL13_XIPMA
MFVFLILLLMQLSAATVHHSLQYIYTASSGIKNFPEFVAVGLVDGNEVMYYDSNIREAKPKQDWMKKVTEDDPQYWDFQTHELSRTQKSFIDGIEVAKQRFNQTGGIHLFQRMYGCEWDEETGEIKGFNQFGYDGEDFVAFDLKSGSWIAPTPEAVVTKHKWDNNKGLNANQLNYYNQECPEWIKKYVNYGRSFLMRTVPPSVSLLQKSSSSPVSCLATGFYPNKAEILWRKDGVEIHDGVEKREILSNNDGTFQTSAELKLSTSEDWTKYDCVFQLSGFDKDLVTPLDKANIKTNEGNSLVIILTIVAVVVFITCTAVIIIVLFKRKNAKRPPSPVEYAEVQEIMMPK